MSILKRILGKKKKKKDRKNYTADSGANWVATGTFSQRIYANYEEYVEHQKSKLRLKRNIQGDYDQQFADTLADRLPPASKTGGGNSVLCLAARTGGECHAFVKLGYFPVGVDLNPGEANRFVVVGDFHDLQYADKSVDIVYTNSLDHAFDLDRIIKEVSRVLKDGALFIAEIIDPAVRGPGKFEAIWWSSIDEVASKIEDRGFVAQRRTPFDFPWQGTQIIFAKAR